MQFVLSITALSVPTIIIIMQIVYSDVEIEKSDEKNYK